MSRKMILYSCISAALAAGLCAGALKIGTSPVTSYLCGFFSFFIIMNYLERYFGEMRG